MRESGFAIGNGFRLRARIFCRISETKDEAEKAHSHAAKAVAQAKALKIVNR
jgi:hypothetical protein